MKKYFFIISLSICSSAGFAQNWKAFTPSSWGLYKMEFKDMAQSVTNSMPGLDPKMLEMLPPEQRAQIEAAMKQSQQTMGQQMNSMENMLKEMDMKMTYSVQGEENRNGKAYSWLETDCNGNMPNIDKIWESTKAQMKQYNLSDAEMKKAEENIRKAKADLEKMPQRTKDGKFKCAFKMLMEKPTMNSTANFGGDIMEMWEKQGDNPPRKHSAEELKKRNEANMSSEELNKKKAGSNFVEDVVKIPGVKETPGLAEMAAASAVMSDAQGNMQGSMNSIQQAGQPVEGLGQYGYTQVVTKEIQPKGVEEIQVADQGKIKCLRVTVKRKTVIKANGKDMQEWLDEQEMWLSPGVYGTGMAKIDIASKQTILRISADDAINNSMPPSSLPKPFTNKSSINAEKTGAAGAKTEF